MLAAGLNILQSLLAISKINYSPQVKHEVVAWWTAIAPGNSGSDTCMGNLVSNLFNLSINDHFKNTKTLFSFVSQIDK